MSAERVCYHPLRQGEMQAEFEMACPRVSELMVRGIVFGVFAENCWIIGSRKTGEGIVIDPGDLPHEILHLAQDMGLNIKVIANTHAHIDHVLGVRGVKEATGAKFLLHANELDIARGSVQAAAHMLGETVEPPPEPDALLAEGDEVEGAGGKLKGIHTPGHTPGGGSFYTAGVA